MTAATAPEAPPRSRPLAAALWMSGAVTGFIALAVAGRALATAPDPLDTFEMMLYRAAIGVVAVVIWAAATGRTREIGTNHLPLHALRNVIHFAGQNLWLYALPLIPLATLSALEFSYPLIVALIAPLALGERFLRVRVLAALLGFAGILIVARPFGGAGLSPGLLAAMLSALGFAGAAIVTKILTRRTGVPEILFWLSAMQMVFALICAGADGEITVPAANLLPWVAVLGLSGLAAHVGLTMALSLAPASVVTPIDFLRLPLIAVVGMLAYGEPADVWTFAGGAIILLANWINVRAETRRT